MTPEACLLTLPPQQLFDYFGVLEDESLAQVRWGGAEGQRRRGRGPV